MALGSGNLEQQAISIEHMVYVLEQTNFMDQNERVLFINIMASRLGCTERLPQNYKVKATIKIRRFHPPATEGTGYFFPGFPHPRKVVTDQPIKGDLFAFEFYHRDPDIEISADELQQLN